jgi:4'-phosphopantetheinyl transferase EntD
MDVRIHPNATSAHEQHERNIETKGLADAMPPGVAFAQTVGDSFEPLVLEAEWPLVASAGIHRRKEFAAGRTSARRALRALGIPDQPILRGRNGEPLWPPGIIGSIAHARGYAVAVATSNTDILLVGVDIEPLCPLPRGVLEVVASASERQSVSRLAGVPTCLFFCAKEATYKAFAASAETSLDLSEISVQVNVENYSFVGRCTARGLDDATVVGGFRFPRGYVIALAMRSTSGAAPRGLCRVGPASKTTSGSETPQLRRSPRW